MMKKVLVIITILSFLLLVGCGKEVFYSGELGAVYNGTTYNITNQTIQDYINNASAGDVLNLFNLTYVENLSFNSSAITINGLSNTTLTGCINISVNDIAIKNMIVKGGCDFDSVDMLLKSTADNVLILNSTFKDLTGTTGGTLLPGDNVFGLYFDNDTVGHMLDLVTVQNITGGLGGSGTGAVFGTGGAGGKAVAISLFSKDSEIRNSMVSDIDSGAGGGSTSDSVKTCGVGGTGVTGINLGNHSSLVNVSLSNINGGAGGTADCGWAGDYCAGGTGTVSHGVYYEESQLTDVQISVVSGGEGGDVCESCAPTPKSSTGGDAYGLYYFGSNQTSLARNINLTGITGRTGDGNCVDDLGNAGISYGVYDGSITTSDDMTNDFRNFSMSGFLGKGANVSFKASDGYLIPSLVFPTYAGVSIASGVDTVNITWFTKQAGPSFNVSYGTDPDNRTIFIAEVLNSSCEQLMCDYLWDRTNINGSVYIRVTELASGDTEDANYGLALQYVSYILNSVDLTPLSAYTINNITCTIDWTNYSNLTHKANFSWYQNGTFKLSETNVTLGTTNSSILTPNWTSKHQDWSCNVTMYNTYESTSSSDSVIIQNSLPTTPNNITYWNGTRPLQYINVSPIINATYFECSGSTDADNDDLYYYVEVLTNISFTENTSVADELQINECVSSIEFNVNLSKWNVTTDSLTESNVSVIGVDTCVYNATCVGRCPYTLSAIMNSTDANHALFINEINMTNTSNIEIAEINSSELLFNITMDYMQANTTWYFNWNWIKGWS